ncbi:MAG: ATP-binding protein, partial [Bacteroidota bacterium]
MKERNQDRQRSHTIQLPEDLLRQILHNLLGNACRYGASTVRLQVTSTGQITELSLGNDYQSDSRAPGGLGIGLRLVRALADSMKGHRFS